MGASNERASGADLPLSRQDGLECYDAILSIRNFLDVYDGGAGWELRHNPRFDVRQNCLAVRVAALGPCNSGKTWLLNRLSGSQLPCGTDVRTEGLSIKATDVGRRSVLLLDTEGANGPVRGSVLPRRAEPLGTPEVAGLLAELQTQEEFYRRLAFEVAHVVFLVVGQLAPKDVADLLSLAGQIKKVNRRMDLIVVHNLRDWSRAQLLRKDADGRNYLERTRDMLGLHDIPWVEELEGQRLVIDRHEGLLTEPHDCRRNRRPVQVVHHYLTNDELPCSLNDFCLQDMRQYITIMTSKNLPLGQELAAAASALQTGFVRFSGPEPVIKFDAEAEPKRFVAVPRSEDEPCGTAEMIPRKPGSNGPEEVVYNVTAVPCTLVTDEDTVTGEAYLVQIELPGLTPESFDSIKKSLAKRARRMELPEDGDGVKVLLVDFEAQLKNVPEGFYDVALKTSKHQYAIPSDPAMHKAVEQGTRPAFREGVRTLKVTVRTNIHYHDNRYKPLVTYLDGILGITLVHELDD